MIKVKINSNGTKIQILCTSCSNTHSRKGRHFSGPPRSAHPESNPEETPDKPKLMHSTNQTAPFKTVKVMKDKERLRNGFRLKETKERDY